MNDPTRTTLENGSNDSHIGAVPEQLAVGQTVVLGAAGILDRVTN